MQSREAVQVPQGRPDGSHYMLWWDGAPRSLPLDAKTTLTHWNIWSPGLDRKVKFPAFTLPGRIIIREAFWVQKSLPSLISARLPRQVSNL